MSLRDFGVVLGRYARGDRNSITDVEGVLVGQTTVIEEESGARTGVTVILPRDDVWDRGCYAGCFSFNGAGEMTGLHWVREAGILNTPIGITSTTEVGAVRDYILRHGMDTGKVQTWRLPVVGETFDGMLNDTSTSHITYEHVKTAIETADENVEQGSAGGGTGMMCHQFKGGTGTSSRRVSVAAGEYTVGALVQANYGRRPDLRMAGVLVGDLFPHVPLPGAMVDGSVIIIVATDAPLLPIQCQRLAKRATVGLARVGGSGHNSSGDIFLAFSTANDVAGDDVAVSSCRSLGNNSLSALFDAVADAVEEAIINAILAGKTMTGKNGFTVHGFPTEELVPILAKNAQVKWVAQ